MTEPEDASLPAWGSPEPQQLPQRPASRQPPGGPELVCPLCGGGSFREEEGRMDTMWGMGSHKFTIRICSRCGHTMFFYQGSGMPM